MRYLSSLSITCFSIPTASRVFIWVPFPGDVSLLRPYVSIRKLYGSSLCLPNVTIGNCLTHFSLLNASSTQTSVSEHCISDLLIVYFCVFFERTFVHTYMIYCEGLRLPAIFSHFACTAPFSAGYISTAEANLMSTHILKVCCV